STFIFGAGRSEFSPDFTKTSALLKSSTDGASHAAVLDLQSGAITDLTSIAGRASNGYSDPPDDSAPVFVDNQTVRFKGRDGYVEMKIQGPQSPTPFPWPSASTALALNAASHDFPGTVDARQNTCRVSVGPMDLVVSANGARYPTNTLPNPSASSAATYCRN